MLKQSVIFLSYFLCIFSPHFYLFGRGIKKLPHTDSSFQMCTTAGARLGQSQRLRTQSRLVYRIRGLYYLNRHQWPPRYTLGWTWTWVRHSNIEYEHFNQALNCCTNAHLHLQIILNTCLSKKEKICFEFEGRITWRGHTQRHLERDNKNNTRTHKGRGRERDSSIHWFTFTPQMARMTTDCLNQSQESGITPGCQEPQHLGHIALQFQTLAKSWIGLEQMPVWVVGSINSGLTHWPTIKSATHFCLSFICDICYSINQKFSILFLKSYRNYR